MIAGRMKYKLALLMPSTIENDFGEAKTTYEQTRIVNAERVKNNGKRKNGNKDGCKCKLYRYGGRH